MSRENTENKISLRNQKYYFIAWQEVLNDFKLLKLLVKSGEI